MHLKEGPDPEVYVAFNPRFERIWLESRKRFPEYMEQKPANTKLRSQYSIRFYDWSKKYVEAKTKTISPEELHRVLGLESVKGCGGQRHSRSAYAGEGELPATGAKRCACGDQREDGFEDQARVARTIKASARGRAEFCN